MNETTITREKLTLTKEQAQELVSGDLEGFETVEDEQIGKRRWSIDYRIIVKRLSDGKFFADTYSCGATEQQEEYPYDNSDPDFSEVFPVEKTVTVYK